MLSKTSREQLLLTVKTSYLPYFGKTKYGGPFTTEQVEDVKTLFRVVVITLIRCAFYGMITQQHSNRTNLSTIFSVAVSRSPKYTSPVVMPINEILIHPRALMHTKSHRP